MEKKSEIISLRLILIIMTIGIWAIVLQNTGIIPTIQNVYVKGGYIDADVSGSVDVDNIVRVRGDVEVSGSVDVDNTVSVSIDEVLGKDDTKYYYNNR